VQSPANANSHLVVFDIDGTLTDTNVVDGECYWQAVCEVLGLSGEQPDWSNFRHVTDTGIATELCRRHLGRQLRAVESAAIGTRLAALLAHSMVSTDPVAYQIPGCAVVLSFLRHASEFAVALATGGLRVSAELKLKRAELKLGDLPFATTLFRVRTSCELPRNAPPKNTEPRLLQSPM